MHARCESLDAVRDRDFRGPVSCRDQTWQMILCVALASLATAGASAAPGSSPPVSFRSDIAPLLQRRCLTCHNEDSAKGGYRMHTFEHLLKPGDSELAPVVAGKIGESELVHLLR